MIQPHAYRDLVNFCWWSSWQTRRGSCGSHLSLSPLLAAFPFPHLLAQTSGSLDGGNFCTWPGWNFCSESRWQCVKTKNICVFCVLCDSFVSNCFSGIMRFCFVFLSFVMTQQWRNVRFFPMKLTAVQITPSSAKRRCGVGAVPGASSGVSVVVFRCCFFFNTLSQMLHVGNTYLHLA